jgi:5-methylcytosine-specific restriction endonuclease McrA
MNYFDLKTENEVVCEACLSPANDIHHIHGRGLGMDTIKNLMALCRRHHTAAHTTIPKDEMQLIHNYFLTGQRKQFLS